MGARSSRNTTQNNRSDGHLLEYFRNTFVRGGGGGGTWGFVGPQVGGVGGGPAGPYAGAGNGASHNPTGASPRVVATSGLENTGSGGGGGTSTSGFLLAGKGGSGIVLIAYPS